MIDRIKKYQQKYRVINKNKLFFMNKVYRVLHSDEISVNKKVAKILYPQRFLDYEKNRPKTLKRDEQHKKSSLKWRHSVKGVEKSREYSSKNYRLVRYQVLMYYSNNSPQCACCGELEYDFLSVDHIEPVKKRDRLLGYRLYRYLIKQGFPKNIQILCYNCNCVKWKNQSCAHSPTHVYSKRGKEYSRNKKFQDKIKYEVFSFYSKGIPKCECCGLTDIIFLTMDHINKSVRAKEKGIGGYRLYLMIRNANFPEGYRVLCYNCNMVRKKDGICPHKKHDSKRVNVQKVTV